MHDCVTNMPGAVPRTSTLGLTNATLPSVQALAGKGWRQAMLAWCCARSALPTICRAVP